jgi:hypothetical protein
VIDDLATILFRCNDLLRRLVAGDLAAAGPLAEEELALRSLSKGPWVSSGIAITDDDQKETDGGG